MAVDTHDDERPPELMSEAERRLMEAAAMPPGEAAVDLSGLAMSSRGLAGSPLAAPEPAQGDEYTEAETNARERLEELRDQRQTLVYDGLTDEQAVVRLAAVEDEMGNCQTILDRTELLRAERDRRQAQARTKAEAEARAEALDRARELGENRRNMARLVDAGARAFARAVADYRGVVDRQSDLLRAAGRRPALNTSQMTEYALEMALAHALGESGVRGLFEIRTPNLRHVVPLLDGDPAPALGVTDAG